jgi:hypothetical protein
LLFIVDDHCEWSNVKKVRPQIDCVELYYVYVSIFISINASVTRHVKSLHFYKIPSILSNTDVALPTFTSLYRSRTDSGRDRSSYPSF